MKKLIFLILFPALVLSGYSQESAGRLMINNFIIKEHLLKNEKIVIIACDQDEKPLEHITGSFQFSINGFKQDLQFSNGIALAPQAIDKSTFIHLRHVNENGTHGKLYYVFKRAGSLNPIRISWLVILIPAGLILFAMLFRKFIMLAILLAALFFFISNKGLSISTFFDMIFDGLRSIIQN